MTLLLPTAHYLPPRVPPFPATRPSGPWTLYSLVFFQRLFFLLLPVGQTRIRISRFPPAHDLVSDHFSRNENLQGLSLTHLSQNLANVFQHQNPDALALLWNFWYRIQP